MTDLQKLEAVGKNYIRFTETEQKLLKWQAKAERTTRPLQGSHSKSYAENWREDAVIQMTEARDKLAEALNEYIDSWQVARTVLDAVSDPDCYEVLFRRYIQGYSWKRIAEEMGCSRRNCVILHQKAAQYMLQISN